MRKTVMLELEIEHEFDSAIYVKLGDMLMTIEDSDFEIKNVKVVDVPKTVALPNLRSEGMSQVVRRSYPNDGWKDF